MKLKYKTLSDGKQLKNVLRTYVFHTKKNLLLQSYYHVAVWVHEK